MKKSINHFWFKKKNHLTLLAFSFLSIYSSPTFSQTPDIGAEEGLRRQEERDKEQLRQLQPQSDELTPSPPSQKLVLPPESPCFDIKEVVLTGESADRFNWLNQRANFSVPGHCIGAEGAGRVAAWVDSMLIRSGYATTRVSLPAQNLSSGTLTLQMHVGRIADIRMVQDGAADYRWGTWQNAFPTSKGRILNIRDLEQGVEQMKRLTSQNVATRILPGEQPDTSIVEIERKSGGPLDRLHGGLTVDNSGSDYLGRTQLSGYVTLENPLGLNDILSLSANSNAENPDSNNRSQSANASYSIPFGYHSISLSGSYNRYAQVVQGTTVQFLSSGKSETADARWDFIAMRTASAKFGLYADLSIRRAHSYLDDIELIIQRRSTTNIETGFNYRQILGQASIGLEVGYRQGVPWIEAQDDLPPGGPTLRPRLWLYSANYNQPFHIGTQPMQYNLSIRGQQTDDFTTSTDQFSIGNRYSVRGFDGDVVLMAESGITVRNELSTQLNLIDGVDLAPYIGIDYGRVWGDSAQFLIGQELAGAAIGLRGRWKGLQFDAALGTPIYKPKGFPTHHLNPYLSLTWAF